MKEFSRRVSQKLDKLTPLQIQQLVEDCYSQTEIFDSIFQSLPSGLIIVDENFCLIKINKAAERYLPFKSNPEESKEKSPVWNIIDDEEISRFLQNAFEADKTNISNEYTVSTSGGSVRFIDLYVTPLVQNQNQNKNLIGSIIRIDDVTEKRNQEVLLHRMETLAGLTNVAASVAHEIKNPLGAISIHIQLMQKALKKKRDGDGLLPPTKYAEDYLDVITQEIERLNKIVVDFLMAVRPISANLELANPNKILEDFISFFMPEFNQKNIKLESELCGCDVRLLLDSKLFREVIVNLSQNAISAISKKFDDDESRIKGRISIKSKIENDRYILTFTDDGTGMDESTAARVFEPYFTTKSNGTGLGMAMSYKIIKEFSGDISVTSALGEGTKFTISIPVPQMEKKLLEFKDCSSAGVEK
ncbi:ATP-binding protein [Treponema sp.]|uniref:two-component system sensor histidine kinase NtrB n=1 Tax=Treponema sp. TaxID=166 RepID=UPI0025DB0AA8|nr:ATP-binding protein [Treponema sp.]MBR4322750.1 PAS domain S-box protein [Treponema sp.]